MKTHLGTELTIIQRIKLSIFGITPTEKRKRPGWSGELLFYAFYCPVHGLVEDYPHGFEEIIKCPICAKKLAVYKKPNFLV